MSNINDTYFDGYYKQIWKTVIPDILTEREIDFMIPYFHLGPGSKVLDLMCGYGRHAIGLGRKGVAVTAVDNLDDYNRELQETVMKENLPVQTVLANVIEYNPEEKFDLALCMGNSLNFFNRADTTSLFRNISSHLKSGGHLLINTWSLSEIVAKNFKEKSWSLVGDLKYLVDGKFLFQPARIETESTIIAPDGSMEVKQAVDYIFSINEMEAMLQEAGLTLKEVYSIPGKKKFTIGEPRAYLVVEKTSPL